MSSVTFAEIRFGIGRLRDLDRRNELEHWLETELRPWFGGRVIEIDEGVILRWRQLVEEGRKVGRTYSQPDLGSFGASPRRRRCHPQAEAPLGWNVRRAPS